MSMPTSGPMISCTSPPEQKLPPLEREHHDIARRRRTRARGRCRAALRSSRRSAGSCARGGSSRMVATPSATLQRKCCGLKSAIDGHRGSPCGRRAGGERHAGGAARSSASRSAAETPAKRASTRASWSAACARTGGGPSSVSATCTTRRSAADGVRRTRPSLSSRSTTVVVLPLETSSSPRQLAHRQRVVGAVQRGHHVEAGQRDVVLDAEELAQLGLGGAGGAQQADPRLQPTLRQRLAHGSPPSMAIACPFIASEPGPHSQSAAAVTSAGCDQPAQRVVARERRQRVVAAAAGGRHDVGHRAFGHLGVEVAGARARWP